MVEKNNSQRSERGQSLVEFAFGIVVLLVLLAVAIDTGRAMYTYLSIRDAAQEGALYASINPSDTSGIQQRARQASNLLDSTTGGAGNSIVYSITPTVTGKLCAGQTGTIVHGIKVRITYNNFRLIAPFVGMFIGNKNTIPISAEANNMIVIPKCP